MILAEVTLCAELSKKKKPITLKKAGRILTEVGLSGAANTIMETITSSVSPEDSEKN